MSMNIKRRVFLKGSLAAGTLGVAAGAGLLTPQAVIAAWNEKAFHAESIDDALSAAMGTASNAASDAIKIKARGVIVVHGHAAAAAVAPLVPIAVVPDRVTAVRGNRSGAEQGIDVDVDPAAAAPARAMTAPTGAAVTAVGADRTV